jgi:hypothetical protein
VEEEGEGEVKGNEIVYVIITCDEKGGGDWSGHVKVE